MPVCNQDGATMPWIPGGASLARNDVLAACSNQAATCLTARWAVLIRARFILFFITQHRLKTVFFSTFVFFCRQHLLYWYAVSK